MKKLCLKAALIGCIVISFATMSLAQRQCGSQTYHMEQMESNPEYAKKYVQLEKQVAKNFKNYKANCTTPTFFPVAIHYDWVPSAADQVKLITLAQNQVATLNSSYNGTDCQGTANGNCYEFVIATTGHPTGTGLTEGQPAVTFGGTAGADYCPTDGNGATQPCNLSNWTGYMNITVNNLAAAQKCSDLGVSHLVGNPTTQNSMSVNSCAFGSSGVVTGVANVLGDNACSCLANSINGGATVTHEIGHFLGLFHTFCADDPSKGANGNIPTGSLTGTEGCQQPSVCTTGCVTFACDCDMVTDTPPQAFSNNGCPGGSASGTVNNPSTGNAFAFNNYMDYVNDACMNCFSQGQVGRMATVIASPAAGYSNYKTKAMTVGAVLPGGPVVVTPAPAGSSIPTLGEWGIMILGVLFMIFGIASIRHYSMITSDKV